MEQSAGALDDRGMKISPERLYLLQLSIAALQTPRGPLEMSSGCYLVRMTDGSNVLIDSGEPDELQLAPGAVRTVNRSLLALLGDIGVSPSQISTVICTHFDIDHVGQHEKFHGAEFVVQRRHYERAISGDQRFAGGRTHWGDPRLRYRLVEGDFELDPGGTLIETSGHTAGHQSVLIDLPGTGPVLLAIDAVMMSRLFVPDRPPWPLDENADELRASTRKLLDLVEHRRIPLVVFGHDASQWRDLRLAPDDYYS